MKVEFDMDHVLVEMRYLLASHKKKSAKAKCSADIFAIIDSTNSFFELFGAVMIMRCGGFDFEVEYDGDSRHARDVLIDGVSINR